MFAPRPASTPSRSATACDVTERDADELKRRLARVERDAAGRRQFDGDLRSKVVDYVR